MGDNPADGPARTAAHEWGHWFAAKDAGLNPRGMKVGKDGTGGIERDEPRTPKQVAEAQAMAMAGQAAEDRWARQHGLKPVDASHGDREIHKRWSRLPGATSMAESRARAAALVDKHWGRISTRANRYKGQGR